MMQPPPRTPRRASFGARDLFPDLEAHVYLGHAAISPLSLAVRDAMKAAADDFGRLGVGAAGRYFAQRERLRGGLASLIGADPADIALVPNTSHGVIDIAMCLPWQPGDRVVLFDGEFPTNVTPWQRAAELFGLELVWVPLAPFHRSLDEGVAEVERVVARGARLVAVSVAQFTTGLRMPVERIGAICQRHGCELFVDAIQGAGALPIEVEEASIDYLTAGGHKWLMGPEGAGFVYVAPHRVRELVPRVAGWLSHEDPLAFLFAPNELRYDRAIKKRASMFEPGAQNSVGYAGLEASVDCLLQLGPKAIFDQVQRYFDRVEGPLQELGLRSLRHREMAGRSTILSFELPDAQRTGELVQALGRRGIVCTGPDGLLRLAPHWPNDAGEASSVVEAAREALRAMGL